MYSTMTVQQKTEFLANVKNKSKQVTIFSEEKKEHVTWDDSVFYECNKHNLQIS